MQNWENGCDIPASAGSYPSLHEYLEQKGLEGWELIAVDRTGRLFLRRPQGALGEQPKPTP